MDVDDLLPQSLQDDQEGPTISIDIPIYEDDDNLSVPDTPSFFPSPRRVVEDEVASEAGDDMQL